jgi:hypothetical protein
MTRVTTPRRNRTKLFDLCGWRRFRISEGSALALARLPRSLA